MTGVPQGWNYNAQTKVLTAPNNVQVTDGFAQWILTHDWDADDLPRLGALGLTPVEQGNPGIGGGTVQPFNKKILVWTAKTGVYEMYAGKEWIALYQAWNKTAMDLKAAQAQIVQLQQQLMAAQNNTPLLNDLKVKLTQIHNLSDLSGEFLK